MLFLSFSYYKISTQMLLLKSRFYYFHYLPANLNAHARPSSKLFHIFHLYYHHKTQTKYPIHHYQEHANLQDKYYFRIQQHITDQQRNISLNHQVNKPKMMLQNLNFGPSKSDFQFLRFYTPDYLFHLAIRHIQHRDLDGLCSCNYKQSSHTFQEAKP